MIEKRKETRYTVTEIYQKRLTFKVRRNSGEFAPVKLLDISLRGIRIKYDLGLPVGSVVECSISIPMYLTKEVLFSVKIIYCIGNTTDTSYLIGAEITQTDEQSWVSVFLRIHDFIDESLRIGKM
jgi:hypothetical protein